MRRLIVVLVMTISLCACSEQGSAVELGHSWVYGQEGFGNAHPASIYLGGDTTGLVTDIRWQSWGGREAIGTGSTYLPHYGAAGPTRQRVLVIAFKRGACNGRQVYRAVSWFFLGLGDRVSRDDYLDACTGDWVSHRP